MRILTIEIIAISVMLRLVSPGKALSKLAVMILNDEGFEADADLGVSEKMIAN